jgi:Zn-dependent protease with chaperone function
MVVVPVAAAHAIAVPGRPGRILITQGMLSLLDADERRAVLAHERAHLRGRHHRLCAVAEFCAGLNPLLAPASSAIAFLVERSADEYAAEVTGSRELIARALAKAALAGMGAEPCGGLAFHGPGVIARIAALNAAPPRRAGMVSGGMLVLGLTTAAAAVQATVAFIELFGVLLPG